mmetsp:Transcript_63751/g.164123  ORF Transcript_63751/g.164123 Transcript_63751/m.164123 type:complete len:246 (+) Transcript_63751:1329-2066(+)
MSWTVTSAVVKSWICSAVHSCCTFSKYLGSNSKLLSTARRMMGTLFRCATVISIAHQKRLSTSGVSSTTTISTFERTVKRRLSRFVSSSTSRKCLPGTRSCKIILQRRATRAAALLWCDKKMPYSLVPANFTMILLAPRTPMDKVDAMKRMITSQPRRSTAMSSLRWPPWWLLMARKQNRTTMCIMLVTVSKCVSISKRHGLTCMDIVFQRRKHMSMIKTTTSRLLGNMMGDNARTKFLRLKRKP